MKQDVLKQKKIAFANCKGGVGKTTIAYNVGLGLAHHYNKRVLLIDMDYQANLTTALTAERIRHNVYDLMEERTSFSQVVQSLKDVEGVDFLPNHKSFSKADITIIGQPGQDRFLKKAIKDHIKRYDYVIFDCPPSTGIATQNALSIVDSVYICTLPESLSIMGVSLISEFVNKFNEALDLNVKIKGLITNLYDKRLKEHKEKLKFINSLALPKLPVIKSNSKIRAALSARRSIFSFAPQSVGAENFINLIKVIESTS